MDWKIAGWVGIGSALGGIARYVVSEVLTKGAFPVGTLVVNVTGSILLGVLLASEPRTAWITPAAAAGLGVGALGSFTTMSTFSVETVGLATGGQAAWSAVYVALTGVLCIGGAYGGQILVARALGA